MIQPKSTDKISSYAHGGQRIMRPENPILGECWICHHVVERRSTLCRKHSNILRRRATQNRNHQRDPKLQKKAKAHYDERRLAAGIPAVIPMPYGRYMELPPQEWAKYQEYSDRLPNKRKRFTAGVATKLNGVIRETSAR